MRLPSRVTLVEVGPRDGLQSEPVALPVADRVALIRALAAAGFGVVEAGSFVRPDRVPQMAGTAQVLAGLADLRDVRLPVLVPNRRGLADALAAGAREVAVFAAASETFSQRNGGAGIESTLERCAEVVAAARDAGCRVRGYVSCCLGCPYEGTVPLDQVVRVAETLARQGCGEISLGDTIGAGSEAAALVMVEAVAARLPRAMLAVHFHDTRGQALANIRACLEAGIGVVDCSVAGLGGCPFAPGAAGNVASEAVVAMLHGLGIATGVDPARLAEAARLVPRELPRVNG